MISVNEKVDHLNSIKSKLESTLDELESGLDKEKKSLSNTEYRESKKKKEKLTDIVQQSKSIEVCLEAIS